MDLADLSSKYKVRRLVTSDTEEILKLSLSNPIFYKYCPPVITRPVIRHDMTVVPPHKTTDDKYYVGFFDGDKLIAMLDLIVKYPDEITAWVGLFMVDSQYQGKGIGTEIFNDIMSALKKSGLKQIELAYAKGNKQSKHFWVKNGFFETGNEAQEPGYTAIVMGRLL
ncbi:GNAT family N-acetyltransferase [Companilactobacillus paralimentarius]|jgi:Acetyltransferases|uniref:GNAT family N-acetyltransferase n=1 Tax=Companilactobacillus paralimentarius TaxID=83526 RepID=UPI0004683579|nr:GNAT family N-acetyltransferase [Companilactobacillus paralimentarius]KAE9561139.1 GNAT family acetyltransferase [Companilactobacillus paralimentarius]MDR4933285.1 GNAT family N-acetyltransferase [Companilactobacillus paralimentarius]QFR69787.1 GNAT family N-acetyltransferase [Companilactobacillus paralimentarius]